jgi:xanthine dehydrogenase accessory factor
MSFWNSLADELVKEQKLVLMIVCQSEGSSPGRQGFKMWVSNSGKMEGSVGGGIMEHKLVEWCKSSLSNNPFSPFIKLQIHQEEIAENRSGMICDGHQSIIFFYLENNDLQIINKIKHSTLESSTKILTASPGGLAVSSAEKLETKYGWKFSAEDDWHYRERLGYSDKIYIIGGGHVGLALCEVMNRLDFYVINVDDRELLNTMTKNHWAHEKMVVSYENIDELISDEDAPFVALMSFGYRTDHQIIRKLIGEKYKYFGVMGSQVKINKLFEALLTEGFSQDELDKIHSPIGLKIGSKTPMEIAISVAAEIISVRSDLKKPKF